MKYAAVHTSQVENQGNKLNKKYKYNRKQPTIIKYWNMHTHLHIRDHSNVYVMYVYIYHSTSKS